MKRIALITLILGTALAIAPVASAVVLLDGSVSGKATPPSTLPVGMSPAEYQALTARSEALNTLYGNAVTRLSPSEFRSLYLSGGDRLSPQELAAVVARGEALDARYGNPLTDMTPQQFKAAYDSGVAFAAGPSTTTHAQPSGSTGSGLDWRLIGIAAFGAMLLGVASVAVTRRRHQLGF